MRPSIDCPSYIFKKFDPIVAPVKVFFCPIFRLSLLCWRTMTRRGTRWQPTKGPMAARPNHANWTLIRDVSTLVRAAFGRTINFAPLIEIIERYT
jgi:hypothetical protein